MNILGRIALACALPLMLTSCLLVPGKFTSALTIHADRTFTFTYVGQVIASDPSEGMTSDEKLKPDATPEERAESASKAKEKAQKARERESKNREIAAALAKEAGYRSVVYKGNGLFEVNYAGTGLLTTNFTYPINSDAEVMIPFVALEVGEDGTGRMRAPAFGKSGNPSGGSSSMAMTRSAARISAPVIWCARCPAPRYPERCRTAAARRSMGLPSSSVLVPALLMRAISPSRSARVCATGSAMG